MTAWLWFVVGAIIGYSAARRRSFSPVKCVGLGALLGPLAIALFLAPAGVSAPPPLACQYCAEKVLGSARLCHHCGAILVAAR
jgi:hypothetical protein